MSECPNCERQKQRVELWRQEAYRLSEHVFERERILQLIKELRPAIKPLEVMGRGKATQEWFDILVKHIEEMKK
jgi:hypothetical protein